MELLPWLALESVQQLLSVGTCFLPVSPTLFVMWAAV